MKLSFLLRGLFIVAPLLAVFSQPSLEAYTDAILASPDEIWKAAEEVLEPYGIHKSDAQKYFLETRWIEDRVPRKRNLLPVIQLSARVKQTFERRYRIKVQISEVGNETQITIKGKFQDRPLAIHPQNRWRPAKPQFEDFDAERQIFYKILRQLEINRLERTELR
jgi:hypothetical protein